MDANSHEALLQRRAAERLTWRGPAMMLFARAAIAVVAQGLTAAIFVLRSSSTPWHDTEPWLPVYGTLIDAGCLAFLWRLTKQEGIRLMDLFGYDRTRVTRDILIGIAIVPASIAIIYAGTYAGGWVVYGSPAEPFYFGTLPLPAALYGVLVWPFIWGFTEQMTYNGYLLPRFQVLCRNTTLAVTIVGLVWALQHSFMPLTFDRKFMAYRFVSAIPHSIFLTILYLKFRRLLPLAVTHALLDGASVFVSALLPLIKT